MTKKVDSIQVLLFNIMGIRMGVDMEQIDSLRSLQAYEMRDANRINEGSPKIAYFHEKMPFGAKKIIYYASPRILLPKNEGENRGIIIDEPEDIVFLNISSIRPLPPLVESLCPSKTIWGAAILSHAEHGNENEDIILLVDFYRLLNCETKEVVIGTV